jgi:hypothetical protein
VDSKGNTRYSVRRAATEDERSKLVERPNVSPRVPRASSEPNAARWRVEFGTDRVWLRNDTTQIELSLDEARRIAEMILRG